MRLLTSRRHNLETHDTLARKGEGCIGEFLLHLNHPPQRETTSLTAKPWKVSLGRGSRFGTV